MALNAVARELFAIDVGIVIEQHDAELCLGRRIIVDTPLQVVLGKSVPGIPNAFGLLPFGRNSQ